MKMDGELTSSSIAFWRAILNKDTIAEASKDAKRDLKK